MTRSFVPWGALAFCCAVTASSGYAQSTSSAASQSPSATAAAAPAQPQSTSPAMAAEAKKPKKIWTNEDVNGLSGPVSVVGNPKGHGKAVSDTKPDPQYIASVRKQLEKLQSQLDDTDKQLADLKNFSGGKSASTSGSYQLDKGYNRVPVDQQITNLEAKKNQLEGKIGTLVDEARKRGVQPGDLR